MGRLEGKRAVVTGAASGIGRATARRFAAEGAAVLAVDRDEGAVAETADLIAAGGGRALAVTADAGREDDVKAFIEEAVRTFGGLDVIYANAGISGGFTPLLEQTVDYWEEILRINLIGIGLTVRSPFHSSHPRRPCCRRAWLKLRLSSVFRQPLPRL